MGEEGGGEGEMTRMYLLLYEPQTKNTPNRQLHIRRLALLRVSLIESFSQAGLSCCAYSNNFISCFSFSNESNQS